MVLAQRLGEWISHAPDLELDIAFGNLALDHLGVARALYTLVGGLEGLNRDEDDLAMHRSEREYTNLLLVEQPNGDFATTIVRQVFFDLYQRGLWETLARSDLPDLAGIASRAAKENAYHLEFSGNWLIRLGDGTEESHHRTQMAVDDLVEIHRGDVRGAPSRPPPGVGGRRAGSPHRGHPEPARRRLSEVGRAGRVPHRAPRLLARRDAVDGAEPPGPAMVTAAALDLRAVVAGVVDPEIPVLTIDDLGILRSVEEDSGRVVVTITPTYSGCPAMRQIEDDIETALRSHGIDDFEIRVSHLPPWSTDWLTDAGREKLVGVRNRTAGRGRGCRVPEM